MAKESIKLFVSITTKDDSFYSCPVDSVEIDYINLSVYTKQGGLNFEYKDIKSLQIGIYHDNGLLNLTTLKGE